MAEEIVEEKVEEKVEEIVEEKVIGEDLINEWLKNHEPTICKDYKPSGKSGQKRAKNKNFQSDAQFATGVRKGEPKI